MSPENSTIIADDVDASGARAARYTFAIAAVVGALAAWHYARLGLTLSHYDARAHLVVARRVIDSLTPGWRQFGSVWLPLPHLLNVIPVQWDWNFRTGFFGVTVSIVGLAAGLSALSRYLARLGHSPAAAILLPLAILANPNVLYLQSTPMTEPLLFGLAFMSLFSVDTWISRPRARTARRAGALLAALVLTRYEGWLIAAALGLLAAAAVRRPRTGIVCVLGAPAFAAIAFVLLGYFSTGAWLTTDAFFTPDNPARGSWTLAFGQVYARTMELAGPAVIVLGGAGLIAMAARTASSHGRALLPAALLGSALLPLSAFHAGHPERVRYMVATGVALAAIAGVGLSALPPRVRTLAAAIFAGVAMAARPPLSMHAPMVTEAQWEQPFRDARRAVTTYLRSAYDGQPILASMSSLAHYMQDVAAIGVPLRAFVHEGNGDLWMNGIQSPRHYVGWMLIEEQARDGDLLAKRAQTAPAFLSGFTRVSAGGGLALYRRTR